MDAPPAHDSSRHEWMPCLIWLPRFALIITTHGIATRLLLPGAYYVRWSRSLGRKIYRRRH